MILWNLYSNYYLGLWLCKLLAGEIVSGHEPSRHNAGEWVSDLMSSRPRASDKFRFIPSRPRAGVKFKFIPSRQIAGETIKVYEYEIKLYDI